MVAVKSPIACTELIAKRRPIATQEDTSKLIPKCITCGSWNTLAEATLLKLTMPKKAETTYPATIPIRMEASFTIPFQNVQYSYNDERKDRHSPVLPGTISLAAGAPRHIVDGCRVQGEADGEHNGPGDQRREKHPDLPYKQSDYDATQPPTIWDQYGATP